jgi:hypothetical protein
MILNLWAWVRYRTAKLSDIAIILSMDLANPWLGKLEPPIHSFANE